MMKIVEQYDMTRGCTVAPGGYAPCVWVRCRVGQTVFNGGAVDYTLGVFLEKDEAVQAAGDIAVHSVSQDGDLLYVMLQR